MSINFDQAIVSHSRWKTRLSDVANGASEEKLDPAIIAKDDLCDLGKWIAEAGSSSLKNLPELAELKAKHAEFHRITGDIAQKCVSGCPSEAISLLGITTQYTRTSGELALLIREVQRDCTNS
jgi:hypothetical protein